MGFDALTLSAVCAEVGPRITGGQVQKLVFPDDRSLGLGIYRPGQGRSDLLLVAHPERSRVHLVDDLPPRGIERDTPFALLARKHVRDARVRAVTQPRLERVLRLELERRDDADRHYQLALIVEVMGRRSNLLLVAHDGTILDAVLRAPPSRNPRRPILPHQHYVPPPAQERPDPLRVAAADLRDLARGRGGSLAAFLLESLGGLSPLASREVAFRASGSARAPLESADWPAVEEALRVVIGAIESGDWQPTLAQDAEGRPLDYAPYPVRHLAAEGAALVRMESMSAAVARFHGAARGALARAAGDPLAGDRRPLLVQLERARTEQARRLAALERQLADAASADRWRRAGEAVLARQWEIPPGAEEVEVDGERVALDPARSAVENAQACFERYRRARDTAATVPALLEAARHAAQHLDDLATLVAVADTPDAVRALRAEALAACGTSAERAGGPPKKAAKGGKGGKGPARQAAAGAYRRLDLGDGWEALVGGSAQGNARVTFELAQPDDLWLHARGVPGAHVILRSAQRQSPPEAVVERAAGIAAAQSAARTSGAVEVDITARRHVRKIPGGPPGLVRYSGERTLRVAPARGG